LEGGGTKGEKERGRQDQFEKKGGHAPLTLSRERGKGGEEWGLATK